MGETVIFLDFNGVIIDNKNAVIEEAINVLIKLINENDAHVVVIGSDIGTGTENQKNKIKERLYCFGIYNIDFIDPNFEGKFLDRKLGYRTLGIIDYLKVNYVSKYVILDDQFQKEYHAVALNSFGVNSDTGLKKEDLKSIKFKAPSVRVMNRVEYNYRKPSNKEALSNDLIMVLKRVLKRYVNER